MTSRGYLINLLWLVSVAGELLHGNGFANFRPDIRETPEAKQVTRYLTDYVRKQLPPRADSRLGRYYYLRRWMELSPEDEGARIDIVASEDYELVTGSRPATMDILKSTARIDTSSVSWDVHGATMVGAEVSVNLGFNSLFVSGSASTSLSGSATASNGHGGSGSAQTEFREEASLTFECPPHTVCSVQTWTYVAKLKGQCPALPILDPACGIDEAERCMAEWPYKALAANNMLQANFTFPSIHWAITTREDLKTKYYRPIVPPSRMEESFFTLPSLLIDGAWWRHNQRWVFEYLDVKECNLTSPLFLAGGSPKRTQVVIERPIVQASTEKRRALGNTVHDYQPVRLTILQSALDDPVSSTKG